MELIEILNNEVGETDLPVVTVNVLNQMGIRNVGALVSKKREELIDELENFYRSRGINTDELSTYGKRQVIKNIKNIESYFKKYDLYFGMNTK